MKRSAGNVWHRFACAALIMLGAQMAAAVDSYLLWQFDDDGEQITALNGDKIWVDELSLGDKKANGIRVKQVGGDYLDLTINGGATIFNAWPIDEEQLAAGPGYAIIGNVTPETQFMIEIGNLTGDEWVVLAASTVLSYGALDAAGHIWRSELGIPEGGPWEPGYNVPEPSSALLLLLGGACVALRRRRREGAFK